MKPIFLNILRLSIISLLLAACAGRYEQTLNFAPQEGLRVAVLPFVSVNEKGEVVKQEGRLYLDTINLVSAEQAQTPAQIVRQQVFLQLKRSGLDLISPILIDVDLPHHGFALPGGELDIQKVLAADPSALCNEFLSCDAVLYGKLTRWDRTYLGLQSVNTVGIELKLVSAKDKRVLYEASAEDSEGRGLSGVPTGFAALVVEPIRGLNSEIIVDLARRMVERLVTPLAVNKREQFLDTPPPAIYAALYSPKNGRVRRDEPLIVLLFGSSGMEASFSIGNFAEHIPLTEQNPGNYYGEFIPLPTDAFENKPVTAYLKDKYGRVSEEKLPQPALNLASLAQGRR